MRTKLWQVASGKWQVASGKWQDFCNWLFFVKQNIACFFPKIEYGDSFFIIYDGDKAYVTNQKQMVIPPANSKVKYKKGFTLIEISIVLVIIGLLIGGVIVGRDLIKAAEIRSQISQIEKYNVAVNTFKMKYGYLPGDIPNPDAPSFGFAQRYTSGGTISFEGIGGGDGLLQGTWCGWCGGYGNVQTGGETAMFWVDLSVAKMIDGNFNTATSGGPGVASFTPATTPSISSFLPIAKISNNAYVYVWSPGRNISSGGGSLWINYFGVSNATLIRDLNGANQSLPSFSVNQAYAIDSKIDDGLPQKGKVVAFDGLLFNWSGGAYQSLWSYNTAMNPTSAATAASATTCFDNGNVASATQQYSIGTNGGNGINCALSIKFQ